MKDLAEQKFGMKKQPDRIVLSEEEARKFLTEDQINEVRELQRALGHKKAQEDFQRHLANTPQPGPFWGLSEEEHEKRREHYLKKITLLKHLSVLVMALGMALIGLGVFLFVWGLFSS